MPTMRLRAFPVAARSRLWVALCVCLQWHLFLPFACLPVQAVEDTEEALSAAQTPVERTCLQRGFAALEGAALPHESPHRIAVPREPWLTNRSIAPARTARLQKPRTTYPPRSLSRRAIVRSDDDPPA